MSNNRNKMHDWEYPTTIAGSLAIVTAAYFLPFDVNGKKIEGEEPKSVPPVEEKKDPPQFDGKIRTVGLNL